LRRFRWRQELKLLLASLLALTVGLVMGWVLHTPSERSAATTGSAVALPLPPEPPPPELSKPDSLPETREAAMPEGGSADSLISDALRNYALIEIRAGWSEVRHDAIPDPLLQTGFREFDAFVRRTPREIGRRLAGELTRRDTLAGNDGLAIVQALDEGDLGPQVGIVQDPKRFASLFDCAGGPGIDGVSARRDLGQSLVKGATLAFPSGVYSFDALGQYAMPLPQCLTIAGAGMDATLLDVWGLIPKGALERLTVRDCTLHFHGHSFDLRVAAGLLRCERVRFTGFDTCAGSSCVLYANHGIAIHCTDCRFEGGYGRGCGTLFDVRSNGLLARFDHCSFSLLSLDVNRWRAGATVVFSACSMTDLLDPRPFDEGARAGVSFEHCTIQFRPKDAERISDRPLDELFPDWQARLSR
jgi:hypothetical protein